MAGLVERLQLVVDATTGQAEARFAKLGESADDTAKAAKTAGTSIAATADRVAQARLKEKDAAGQLRVAEARLAELRDSGRAKASQVAAAEEQVARAQRNLQVATQGTARTTREYQRAQSDAAGASERMGRGAGVARTAVTGLVTAGAAFVGLGLFEALSRSIDGFTEGATAAAQFARSTNSSVEQAGQFLGLVGTLGLDLNDLLEIQAEFAQKVAANGQELNKLGVTIDRNANGTVNWATTLANTLEVLQNIPDATERNRIGFQYFGEEGYKQLSRLVNSGISVRDALERIGTPFSEEDIAAAQQYDQALLELSLAGTRIEQSIGRALVPLLTDLATGFGEFLDIVTSIPGPIALTTAAAIALAVTGFNPAAAAGARLSVVTAALSRQLALYNVAAAIGGRSTAALAASQAVAAATGRGLLAAVGGPLGAALIVAGVMYALVTQGVEDFQEASRKAAIEQDTAAKKYGSMAASVEEFGDKLADEAGFWDGLAASRRGANNTLDEMGGLVGGVDDATAGLFGTLVGLVDKMMGGEQAAKGFTDEIKNQKEQLGEYGVQTEQAQLAAKGLNDLIAEGTTSGQEFASAVQAAADAQNRQSETTDLAKAAIDAYNAVTRDAVQVTLDLFDAQLNQRDGLIGVQKASFELGKTVDDAKTPWNEVTEATNRAIGAALSYAGNAADAAVAAARATGQILTPLAEAKIRTDATIAALRESLNAPGLTDKAKAQINDMITKLGEAAKKGDIEAILRLTGAKQVEGEVDQATKDRKTTVSVESRGGPAVDQYLDGIAGAKRLALIETESRGGPAVAAYLNGLATAARLAIIRVESRNGPAVDAYLDRLASESRLALIRVESRGGPAVDAYLDGLASQYRLAIINVETRGGPAVDSYLDGLANRARNAVIGVSAREPVGVMRDAPRGGAGLMTAGPGMSLNLDNLSLDLHVVGSIPRETLSRAERGRVHIEDIRAYEKLNGKGWRSDR